MSSDFPNGAPPPEGDEAPDGGPAEPRRPPDPSLPYSPLGAAGPARPPAMPAPGPVWNPRSDAPVATPGDPAAPAGSLASTPPPPPPPGYVPPSPPATGPPAWKAWQGLLGLFAWVVGTFFVGTVVIVAAAATGLTTLTAEDMPPGLLMAATVAGDLVFIAVPLAFAAITVRPKAWHFGLRRTRFWPTLGWAALALFGWFVFSTVYEVLVNPPGKQTTADDLGINRSTALLITGGFVIIVLAPIVEEFFFRGFIYRTLRNGLVGKLGLGAGIALAAAIDGLLFGFVHATNTPIAILPVLAMLGFAFCLVYERTGSLFAVIALHAVVNTLGYLGAAKNSVPVALGFGGAMIIGCIVVPRLLRSSREPGAGAAAPA